MKMFIVIYSNDEETIWNAFRFANTCQTYDNETTVFLMGKGIEAPTVRSLKFDIEGQMQLFDEHNGKVIGCGVCCELRKDLMPELENELQCTMGTMQDFYMLVKESDKLITF